MLAEQSMPSRLCLDRLQVQKHVETRPDVAQLPLRADDAELHFFHVSAGFLERLYRAADRLRDLSVDRKDVQIGL